MSTPGMRAGDYRPDPLSKIMADVRIVDEWQVRPRAIAAQEVIDPDVSWYQDINTTTRKIDFVKMKAAGCPGVIIRAGQGAFIDEDFIDFWRDAKAAGLARAAYWYYDPRYEPAGQADKFTALFVNDPPELNLLLDAEYPASWGGAFAGWQHVRTFLERVKVKAPALSQEIYTGYYWWYDNVWMKTTVTERAYFKQYPLHLAWYTTAASIVKIPLPWTQAEFRWWQFTSSGDGPKYGVESSSIDLNYFVPGGLDLFKETYKLNTGEPPMPSTVNYYDYIATGNRAIRISWGATSSRISSYSDFLLNTHAQGGALPEDRHTLTAAEAVTTQGLAGDVWVKLYANNGHTVVGWTALTHKGLVQCTEKLTIVTPPPTVEPSIFVTETVNDVIAITQTDGSVKKYAASWTDIHEYKSIA